MADDIGTILRKARDRAVSEGRVDSGGRVKSGGIRVNLDEEGKAISTTTNGRTEAIEDTTIRETTQTIQTQQTPPTRQQEQLQPTTTQTLTTRELFSPALQNQQSRIELKDTRQSRAEKQTIGTKIKTKASEAVQKAKLLFATTTTREKSRTIGRGGKRDTVTDFGITERQTFDQKLGVGATKALSPSQFGSKDTTVLSGFRKDPTIPTRIEQKTEQIGTIVERETLGKPIRFATTLLTLNPTVSTSVFTGAKLLPLIPRVAVTYGFIGVRTAIIGSTTFSAIKGTEEALRTQEQLTISQTRQFKLAKASAQTKERQSFETIDPELSNFRNVVRTALFETSTFFGDRKLFEKQFRQQFKGQNQEQALKLALRERRATGFAEIGAVIGESASIESGGRTLLKGVTRGSKGAGLKAFRIIGGLGFIEGTVQSITGDIARGRPVQTKQALTSGLIGAGTAGPIGAIIFKSAPSPALSTLQGIVYATDLDEFAGDKVADLVGIATTKKVPVLTSSITLTQTKTTTTKETNPLGETITIERTPTSISRTKTPIRNINVETLSFSLGTPTKATQPIRGRPSTPPTKAQTILSSTAISTETPTSTRTSTSTFTNVNTAIGTNVNTNVATNVGTNVATNVNTNVATNVNTNVFVLTNPKPFAFAPFLKRLPRRRFPTTTKKPKKGKRKFAFTPSLFALTLNIKGTPIRTTKLTGLELRPIPI